MPLIEPKSSNRNSDALRRSHDSILFDRAENAATTRHARMIDYFPWSSNAREKCENTCDNKGESRGVRSQRNPATAHVPQHPAAHEQCADDSAICGLFDEANRERTARRIADALRMSRAEVQVIQLRNIARGDADYAARIGKYLGIDAAAWS